MLKQRVITGLALLPIALGGLLWLQGAAFIVFLIAVLGIAAWEWSNLAFCATKHKVYYLLLWFLAAPFFAWIFCKVPWFASFHVILACLAFLYSGLVIKRYPKSDPVQSSPLLLLIAGFIIFLGALASLMVLKDLSLAVFFLPFLMIWAADIGAYFTGKNFGKHKLAPRVSPGKTWEGFFGGIIAPCVLVLIYVLLIPSLLSHFFKNTTWLTYLCITLFTALVIAASVMGDLFESLLKRQRGIKDSSQLLPGHGGVLDRIDSLLAALPVYTLPWILIG